jgi:hypothetical protein
MRVQFERSGGFAGMRQATTVDTETLPPEEGRQLQALVEAAGFFQLPGEITGSPGGFDRFFYTLTVETEGKRHTVRTGEAAAPASLRTLIDWLTKAARKAQGNIRQK